MRTSERPGSELRGIAYSDKDVAELKRRGHLVGLLIDDDLIVITVRSTPVLSVMK